MSKLETIQEQILELTPSEQLALHSWLNEIQQHLWDEQLEQDLHAGRLDDLMNEALEDHRAGRTQPR